MEQPGVCGPANGTVAGAPWCRAARRPRTLGGGNGDCRRVAALAAKGRRCVRPLAVPRQSLPGES